MKCFIVYVSLFVVGILAEDIEVQPTEVEARLGGLSVLQEKKPEKRGIGYNGLGGLAYTSSGLGYDGGLSNYNGIGNGLSYTAGLNGYSGYNGYQSGYTPNNVVGLSGYSYNPLASRVAGLSGGINGYTATPAGSYNNGYYNPAAYSRTTYPFTRGYSANYPANYNNYPNYYSQSVYPNTYNGGLGFGVSTPSVPSTGYSYGPGISGGVY